MVSLDDRLFAACSRGDVEGVKTLLAAGANMNKVCANGKTSFGLAAQYGNTAILKVFLEYCSKGRSILNQQKPYSEDRSNLGYFVFVHKEHGGGTESERLEDTVDNVCYNCEDMFGIQFDDTFIQTGPGFSPDWINEVDYLCDEDVLTPDGMDNLEWDMEVEGNFDLPFAEDDPWSALYLWYAGILSQTSPLLAKSPPPKDIDKEDHYGRRAMHYAAGEGHIEIVKMLLEAGCKPNVVDTANLTPLHLVAARDLPDIVSLLIKYGANVHNKTTDKISPLHVAATRGLLSNVRLLVEAGAHVDTLDYNDRTPLFMAVSRGYPAVVSYLLAHGAKVNIEEIHGYTPLYEAVWQKNVEIVRLLLSAGAKVTQSHLLLHFAVLHRHEDMVRLLIEAGSIINLRDEGGDTPLIVAAKAQKPIIAKLLLDNGASVNCASYVTGNTALHEAVENLRGARDTFEEMLTLLQRHGVDMDAESEVGLTPLELAVCLKKDEAAAALVRRGAVVLRPRPAHHVDLLATALLRGNLYLAQLLVYAGYPLNLIHLPDKCTTPLDTWLQQLKSTPMRLCELCRVVIRRQFGSRVYQKVSKMILPVMIQRYIRLEDIVSGD